MQTQPEQFFTLTVGEIMNKKPKVINEYAKLSEAEKLMREYKIHSLIVLDDNNKFVGIIDAFKCML